MPTDRFTHCSVNTRTTSLEQPIGTASGFARSFLLEIPLPWTKSATDSAQISQDIKNAIAEYREKIGDVSVTLLVPESDYAAEGARFIEMQVVDGTIAKRDVIARDGDIAGIIRAMARQESLPSAATIDNTPWRDIIVCTQGSRDACCGTFGIPLYNNLRQQVTAHPGTRVWRSSHIGGHRFAPTMIDFPTGRSWGFVDDATAQAILAGSEHPATLQPNYRGWVGYQDVALQLLEGQALATIGWQWNEYRQIGTVISRDEQGRGVSVEITGTHPQLPMVTFRGDIEWGEEFTTIASCNAAPVSYARKKLVHFERIVHEPAPVS